VRNETYQILVVEDEAIVRMALKDKLESNSFGYEVPGETAFAEEAIELAAELSPDLVLMDIRLAGAIDGIEAAEQIRVRFDIPVVYLTAHADQATLERARKTGPYGYLIKPVEDKALHTAVEVAIFTHGMEWKLKESEQKFRSLVGSIEHVRKAIEDGVSGYILKTATRPELANAAHRAADDNFAIDPILATILVRRRTDRTLSDRQYGILRLMANGKSNKEIAQFIRLGLANVGKDLRKIYDFLGVNDRAHAVHEAWRRGLLP